MLRAVKMLPGAIVFILFLYFYRGGIASDV
jgi:hypothetical protein